jgi:glycosyltransferase involved in cell wall biosynthesis
MDLSICIPTYNRPNQLPNCLNSIYLAKKNCNFKFEVCISDNASDYNVKEVVNKYKKKLNIKLDINKKNLGYQPNLLNAISISKGEFVWAIGDDDLLMPNSLKKIEDLLAKFKDVDFFYVNSYHLDYAYLNKFKKPFDTKNLPKKMEKVSKKKENMKCNFWDLVDYRVSFDFLLGNFLNIFRRKMWLENVNCLDRGLLKDKRVWSNFDNTCAHIKIYANAFKNSKAYFHAEALTVNAYGIREWKALYPFIEIVRLPEMLNYYRSRGLGLVKYIVNKNYALRNFSNYFFKILIRGKKGGLNYINFYRHFFLNLLYPNVYLSFFYFLYRKLRILFRE